MGNVFKDVTYTFFLHTHSYVLWCYLQEAIKIAEMAERGLGLSSLAPIELNDRALILPRGN